ncbi:hypothetical protein BDK51DRAFT_43168 [Blyttiomyces helicus]|uniref:Uncharacterized protein n=1 Tax=Blyttiomyces helicus TaxID=388810 RepID=A0A4P9WDK0_9FUNG|nr:hypothetical protein BDK51DRAFT_43168 [Blyttiomyces helicus]|eukprot:RKO90779.1 hypothetical protein BDK51DRAFT_43168 [Blyttiomyces helicus]
MDKGQEYNAPQSSEPCTSGPIDHGLWRRLLHSNGVKGHRKIVADEIGEDGLIRSPFHSICRYARHPLSLHILLLSQIVFFRVVNAFHSCFGKDVGAYVGSGPHARRLSPHRKEGLRTAQNTPQGSEPCTSGLIDHGPWRRSSLSICDGFQRKEARRFKTRTTIAIRRHVRGSDSCFVETPRNPRDDAPMGDCERTQARPCPRRYTFESPEALVCIPTALIGKSEPIVEGSRGVLSCPSFRAADSHLALAPSIFRTLRFEVVHDLKRQTHTKIQAPGSSGSEPGRSGWKCAYERGSDADYRMDEQLTPRTAST